MLTCLRGDVAIKIFGTDLAKIDAAAQAIAARMRPVSGAAEVIAPSNSGVQYLASRSQSCCTWSIRFFLVMPCRLSYAH